LQTITPLANIRRAKQGMTVWERVMGMPAAHLVGTAVLAILSGTSPSANAASEPTICEIAHHPSQFVGKNVIVDGRLVDISPHGIYVSDVRNSRCILDVGNMSSGSNDDIFSYFVFPGRKPTPIVMDVKVRIRATVRSEMRQRFNGDLKYRSYFLDEMKIIRLLQ
jgi:hypothetical protein